MQNCSKLKQEEQFGYAVGAGIFSRILNPEIFNGRICWLKS